MGACVWLTLVVNGPGETIASHELQCPQAQIDQPSQAEAQAEATRIAKMKMEGKG